MKKLIILAFLGLLLCSCQKSNIETDPQLKESERIAVLEKAKYDTINYVVHIDDRLYIMEKKEVKGVIDNKIDDYSIPFVILVIIAWILVFSHIFRS